MSNENTVLVTFTQEKFEQLKKAYAVAVKAEQTQFTFEGNVVMVDYAKYLIEYLNNRFRS